MSDGPSRVLPEHPSVQSRRVSPQVCELYLLGIADTSSPQSVVRCLWHPKLNQIMVGTGNGLAKVYYDPVKSQR